MSKIKQQGPKQQRRQERVQQFEEQVEAQRRRLESLNPATNELIDLFTVGLSHRTRVCTLGWAARQSRCYRRGAGRLNQPKWKVRRTCADLLDHWGDNRCVEPLLSALSDEHENVRR
jgi:hypothetical protein